jgi:hypothetical protein
MYENRTMKPVKIIRGKLIGGKGNKGERWREQIQLRYVVNTYVNVSMYLPPVQP